MLLLLLLQHSGDQHRIQIFRDRRLVPLCRLHYLAYRHDSVHDIQCVKRLLGASDPVGLLLGPGRAYPGVGITHIGVLQLLRIRLASRIQHKALGPDMNPLFQLQILSRHRHQQAHASGTVSQAVVRLQGNPAAVIIKPHQIAVISLKMHGLAGVFHIRLHKGPGPVVGLQIAPEYPLADGRLVCGKSGHDQIYRLLQHFRVYLLFQYH